MAKISNLEKMRHSCSHLMAAAVQILHPKTRFGIGPSIEDGFYYDFDLPKSISESDLPKIEKKMRELAEKELKFEKTELPIKKALETFKKLGQNYKVELIKDLQEEGQKKVTLYKLGSFIDLCQGPHLRSTKEIGPFKLLSVAGAYWRGSEVNPMLTRIYGTCFASKSALEKHLIHREEAKKRDHRKLGQDLELFTFSEMSGPGLALWLPNGTIIREELENWAKETEKAWGYKRVATPHIGRRILYETSSHLPYYEEDMYPPMRLSEKEKGEGDYFLKAMNCPHHHLIYASKIRSYKELPLRLAEYGTTYRYEKSGELHGLMRVRGFCVNDSHIYCTEDQAKDEFIKVLELHAYYYKILGIKDYFIELGLRDPQDKGKYHGNEAMWKESEEITKKAMKEFGIEYVEKEGAAAFYGPKADFQIKTVTGKLFTGSTNQIDFYMSERFNLKYMGPDGREHRPVIIHRAPLGSHERFIGFLTEHYGGAFPVWLSPVQAVVIPITDKHNKYGKQITNQLKKENIKVKLDDRGETTSAKIRDGEIQRIPYMLVVGDKEVKAKKINVRTRGEKVLGSMSLAKFLKLIKEDIAKKRQV